MLNNLGSGKTDHHIHTSLCDGHNTPEEIVLHAIECGMELIGFSGHSDPPVDDGVKMNKRLYIDTVNALKSRYGADINIYLGIEQDLYGVKEYLSELDYIIGSAHYMQLGDELIAVDLEPEMNEDICHRFFGDDWYKMCAEYFRQEMSAYELTNCDIVGHFDLVSRYNGSGAYFDEEDKRYVNAAAEAIEYLVKDKDLIFEINTREFYRKNRKQPYPALTLLKILHEMGGRIVINSDAHKVSEVYGLHAQAAQLAATAGFTCEYVMSENGFTDRALQI